MNQAPKIYTTEAIVDIDQQQVALCVSAYTDCILIVVNETGSVGSILRGELAAMAQQDDFDYDEGEGGTPEFIYEQKVLFGSTEIDFYQLLMRKLLEVIFEEHKVPMEQAGSKMRVLLNVALRLNRPGFDQTKYFVSLLPQIRGLLKEIL